MLGLFFVLVRRLFRAFVWFGLVVEFVGASRSSWSFFFLRVVVRVVFFSRVFVGFLCFCRVTRFSGAADSDGFLSCSGFLVVRSISGSDRGRSRRRVLVSRFIGGRILGIGAFGIFGFLVVVFWTGCVGFGGRGVIGVGGCWFCVFGIGGVAGCWIGVVGVCGLAGCGCVVVGVWFFVFLLAFGGFRRVGGKRVKKLSSFEEESDMCFSRGFLNRISEMFTNFSGFRVFMRFR